MITEKLIKEDVSTLKSYLIQSIIPFVIIGLFSGLLLFWLWFYLGTNNYLLLLTSGSLIIYLIIVTRTIKNPLFDLLQNNKRIRYEILKGKNENARYGFHMNLIADIKTQPVLYEFSLVFDDFELLVEKKEYDNFYIGERLKLSISMFTNKLLRIEKV